MSRQNVRLVERAIAAVNDRDIDRYLACCTEDVELHTEALRTMAEHQVRRLPVIDGHDLIGMVSQADVARNLDEEDVGELVEAISKG